MTTPASFGWLRSAPVLTGVLVTVLLLIPSLSPSLGRRIIGAAALSTVVTLPFSLAVGKAMT